MADLESLRKIAELVAPNPEWSAALAEAIADSRRLDKVERMRMFIRPCADIPRSWVGAFADPDHYEVRMPTVREGIDEVPE